MRISIDEAKEKVSECAWAAKEGDHERAHSIEDGLLRDVIETIALGLAQDPRALADIAARTAGIDFERWCA